MTDMKTAKNFFLFVIFPFLVVAFSFFPAVLAQTTTLSIPTLQPYVNDFTGVLTQDQINSINSLAAQIEQNSTVQIAVLVVNTTQPLSIDDYANQVFRANGIGHSDNNNGLLIVAAINDRQWRFEVGYGLEGVLPDALVGQIGLTDIQPNFRNGTYGQGLYLAVQSVGNIIEGNSDTSIISQNNSFNSYSPLDLLVNFSPFIIIIFIPIIFFATNDISRCPKCGSLTFGKSIDDNVNFVCKNGHTWTKKKKRNNFFFLLALLGMGRGGNREGGGGFGGGSSGGGGASGGW